MGLLVDRSLHSDPDSACTVGLDSYISHRQWVHQSQWHSLHGSSRRPSSRAQLHSISARACCATQGPGGRRKPHCLSCLRAKPCTSRDVDKRTSWRLIPLDSSIPTFRGTRTDPIADEHPYLRVGRHTSVDITIDETNDAIDVRTKRIPSCTLPDFDSRRRAFRGRTSP